MPFSRTRLISALVASAALSHGAHAQSADKPDLSKQPTLYAVGYAHLDTEWRWEYPQVIDEYLRRTLQDNFHLIETYPHYIFNFSGANRYRLMQEYYPADFERLKRYVAQGRWYPAGSSMEEGDVNAPNAEAVIREVLYGNEWFRKNVGTASAEYMLPDCFGFPSSLPSILAHSGVKGFSTQKLSWGSSADGGGPESLEKTPTGTPFNVGVWVGPDGKSVLAGVNPGAYNGGINTDLSAPLPPMAQSSALADVDKRMTDLEARMRAAGQGRQADPALMRDYFALRSEQAALRYEQGERERQRFQGDWAARVLNNGKVTGLYADYHYYGTGDIGGAPSEESVKRLEAIVTKGSVDLPPADQVVMRGQNHPAWPTVGVGQGPVRVISAKADQMFKDITPEEEAKLPRYTGEMELTNHSAGSLTSQAYQKRWIRKEELLADAAEKSSIMAQWLGGRTYPLGRLNDAWTLAMAAHFHDLAAGTATPRAYEFAWNDDVIAMNQFAGVFQSGTDAVTQALNTETKGTPVVVFNQLNIPREDVVEASLNLGGKTPSAVRVTSPEGAEVPSQVKDGKVLFVAKVPSTGYAVYDVEPVQGTAPATELKVSERQLENEFYRVTLNDAGDVASIFDKKLDRELLSAPARLALSYDNPQQWPAWNMDWDQEQAAPREYVSGPAKFRIAENGPARVAIEITRETAGSRFVQTIRLSTGDAGKRVEFANVVDWATRERSLKASFPLTATNQMATYNWDIGTIERPSAEPKKFEVPSHQWIDLTDAGGAFGATVLTDAKNGSDKPNDNTLRLTLLLTPGTSGGYADQATQDIGHHEFLYGFAGHAAGWRQAQTDWQGQRLNAPLIAFEAPRHGGTLGRSFSLLQVGSPRVRVLAVKKAENSDEVVVRLVELDGRPQKDVHIGFAAPITAAREINGQEQPVGAATLEGGQLVTSFTAYQPRTFAVKLGPAPGAVEAVRSAPVKLAYDLATASNDGQAAKGGFTAKGEALPAEMLPAQLKFRDVEFALAPAKTGAANAVAARGQRLTLPEGNWNRVYVLAASADGDQKAAFEAGGHRTEVTVENWGGFVGQWDDREWSSSDTAHGSYGQMTGLKPGFIKRADLAWYASHHHDAAGKNVAYSYSYLFAYPIDLPSGAKTLTLPRNPAIRILAVSVANEGTGAKPLQPLYDELPTRQTGPADFALLPPETLAVTQSHQASSRVLVLPRGAMDTPVKLSTSGLPQGVSASVTDGNLLTLKATDTAAPGKASVTVTGTSGAVSRSAVLTLDVSPLLKGTVPVDMTGAFNVTGIRTKGSRYEASASLDGEGGALAAETLGSKQVGDGVPFRLGKPGVADAATGKTVSLPGGRYASLRLLATAVEGNQPRQSFTVQYADGTSATHTQGVSDWANSAQYRGESLATEVPYRITETGDVNGGAFHLWSYSIPLDPTKEVRSIVLPANRNVVVFAMTLVPSMAGSSVAAMTAPAVR